jgi:hypothetical protein
MDRDEPRRRTGLKRRSFHRKEKARTLIVCEGKETEPNYFRGLRQEDAVRERFNVVIQTSKGGSCLAVVERALQEMNKATSRGEAYDDVWCVFDAEHASQKEQVIEAQSLATANGMRLAISNPSFEVWLLAHFLRTKRSFADCDRVIQELNKYWQREFNRDYDKTDERLYFLLANRTQTAIGNAQRVREQDWALSSDIVECNSATDVYLLVNRLLGPAE